MSVGLTTSRFATSRCDWSDPAFAHELRVPGHLDEDARRRQGPGQLAELGGGTDRHGGLSDQEGGPGEPRDQRLDRGAHLRGVRGQPVAALRGPDADEVDVRVVGELLDRRREPELSRGRVALQEVREARLEDATSRGAACLPCSGWIA